MGRTWDFGTIEDGKIADLVLLEANLAHPEFRLVRDPQGAALSSHADRAVILLDAPLEEQLSFVPLSEREVQENEDREWIERQKRSLSAN